MRLPSSERYAGGGSGRDCGLHRCSVVGRAIAYGRELRVSEADRSTARTIDQIVDAVYDLLPICVGVNCLIAEHCWDQVRCAIEDCAWRFDGLAPSCSTRRS